MQKSVFPHLICFHQPCEVEGTLHALVLARSREFWPFGADPFSLLILPRGEKAPTSLYGAYDWVTVRLG